MKTKLLRKIRERFSVRYDINKVQFPYVVLDERSKTYLDIKRSIKECIADMAFKILGKNAYRRMATRHNDKAELLYRKKRYREAQSLKKKLADESIQTIQS